MVGACKVVVVVVVVAVVVVALCTVPSLCSIVYYVVSLCMLRVFVARYPVRSVQVLRLG